MQVQIDLQSPPRPGPEINAFPPEAAQDPEKIKEAIALLVASDQIDMAAEMADLGLLLFPESESVLAISALVAEVKQNWFEAHQILLRLQEVQTGRSDPATLQHRIRVLRCMGAVDEATQLCGQALVMHPGHEALMAEQNSLQDQAAQTDRLTEKKD